MKLFIYFLILISFQADAQNFYDHVLPFGQGSGVLIKGDKGLTARHVLGQMQFGLGGNENDECCKGTPIQIGNYDSFSWTYIPGASKADIRSLRTGKINFNTLNSYNDWAGIHFEYQNIPNTLEIANPMEIPIGSSLIAVGHLQGKQFINDKIALSYVDEKSIVFDYEQGSKFGRGFSGGGLFLPDGRLIGIIFAMEETTNRGAATSIQYIKKRVANSCAAHFSGLSF